MEELKEEREHWKQTHDLDQLTGEELAEYHRLFSQRYELDDYVIMPNPIHVLVKPMVGSQLVDILHSWKSFTAIRSTGI